MAIRRACSAETSLIVAPTPAPLRAQPVEGPVERIVERARRPTPVSRWNALTTSVPVARSDFKSARPDDRSRQRNGST